MREQRKQHSCIRTNLATPMAPVWRRRIALPLTPRAVRLEMIEAGDIHLTPLDKMLDDAQADALEQYAVMEGALNGNARAQDYAGDRVRGTRLGMAPLPDRLFQPLRWHAEVKRWLTAAELNILAQFCLQQSRDERALSDAQLGIMLAPSYKNKAVAWRDRLVKVASRLVALQRSIPRSKRKWL